jgi:hypothetical protein
VDAGTNGGVAWTRPDSVPARSDTLLVTHYDYNAMAVQSLSGAIYAAFWPLFSPETL